MVEPDATTSSHLKLVSGLQRLELRRQRLRVKVRMRRVPRAAGVPLMPQHALPRRLGFLRRRRPLGAMAAAAAAATAAQVQWHVPMVQAPRALLHDQRMRVAEGLNMYTVRCPLNLKPAQQCCIVCNAVCSA